MSLPLLLPALKTAFASIGPALQAALSVGTTALGYMGQQQTAKAQEAAIEQANADARVQAINDYDQMTRAGLQEKAAGTQKMTENAVSAKKAVASATASASEGGVGGLSVVSLLSDIYGQEARIRDGVNQNLESTQHQMKSEMDNVGRSLKNTIMTRPQVQKPSLTGALLGAGTGIYDAYKDNLRVSSQLEE